MDDAHQNSLRPDSLGTFLVLVAALSLPLYVLGSAGGRLPIATFLPVSALMAFVPMVAGLLLVTRQRGVVGARELLGSAVDFRWDSKARWVLIALLLMPCVAILQHGALRLSGAVPPEPQFVTFVAALAFFMMFLVGAIGEEVGWQGYAYPALRRKWSALSSSLILGAIWALWHVIPYAQLGRGADWILWQGLGAIALRIIMVWLFVNAGESIALVVLLHATINIPWGLIENYQSLYDPLLSLLLLAMLAGLVVALWGPSTLGQFRFAKRHK